MILFSVSFLSSPRLAQLVEVHEILTIIVIVVKGSSFLRSKNKKWIINNTEGLRRGEVLLIF
jgi:hypothetical protein